MTRHLRGVIAELYGLFVDDGPFALAIVVWIALGRFLLPRLLAPGWDATLFAIGLIAIVLLSTTFPPRRSH